MGKTTGSSIMAVTSTVAVAVVIALIVNVLCTSGCEAYITSSSLRSRKSPHYSLNVKDKESTTKTPKRRHDGSKVTLYLYPSARSRTAASQSERPKPYQTWKSSSSTSTSTVLPAMSASVLSPTDTLPSFHSAHGLLSPEVVRRIGDTNDLDFGGPH